MRPIQQHAGFDDALELSLAHNSFRWADQTQSEDLIETILSIPNSTDKVALLSFISGKSFSNTFRNAIRCLENGVIIWRAELPESAGDFYTQIEWSEQQLIGYSWSGFRVVLDLDTGNIQSKRFTK